MHANISACVYACMDIYVVKLTGHDVIVSYMINDPGSDVTSIPTA